MSEAGIKVSKQAPKNPRKNTKKANNIERPAETVDVSASSAMEMGESGISMNRHTVNSLF